MCNRNDDFVRGVEDRRRRDRFICECREVRSGRDNRDNRCNCHECRRRRRRELECRCREV